MSDTYTFVKGNSGRFLFCSCGKDHYAVIEFAGFCEECWIKLTPTERAILKGEEPPVKEVLHEHHTYKETVYPPKPWWGWRWANAVLRATEVAAIALLLWRASR